jgi:hypothetical protein
MKRDNNKAHLPLMMMFILIILSNYCVANGQDYFSKDYQHIRIFVESIPILQNERERVRDDLYLLFTAYPINCTGIEITENSDVYVIMKNGARIIYDDRKKKSFKEKLADPDLQDMLEQKYIPGAVNGNPAENYDPGRIRVISFFQAIYGETENDVIRNSINIGFINHKVVFNSIEGASDALQKVQRNLSVFLREHPELFKYVNPIGGTLKWRVIEGTQRLSPHSFAIAIDLDPNQCAYWRWRTEGNNKNIRNEFPQSIISIFEEQGFIWGGKWFHYDLMHFEYRPELLLYNKLFPP